MGHLNSVQKIYAALVTEGISVINVYLCASSTAMLLRYEPYDFSPLYIEWKNWEHFEENRQRCIG